MPGFSPRTITCKGLISELSPPNALRRASSQVTSSRTLKGGFINSWPKAILAAGFFCLTCYVIFEDVLRHDAAITTDHLLSFGVLVGTFAAGHWFWPTLRQVQLGGAVGLALLFVVGTLYCVITSAGRNAEALTAKASKVTAEDGPRAALERQVKAADKTREEAKQRYDAAQVEADNAEAARAKECDSGKKTKCGGKTFNAEVAAGRASKRKTEFEQADSNYWMLDARLSQLVKKDANGDLKYAAKVLNYFPHVAVTEDQLADLIPFAKSLFCEFMTLVLAAGAFGHRKPSRGNRSTSPTVPVQPSRPQPPGNRSTPIRNRSTGTVVAFPATVPQDNGTVPHPVAAKDAALELLRSHLAEHGTVPQDALKELFGVGSKSTVSRWCDEWEAAGIIRRETIGRRKEVTLSKPNKATRFG